MINKHNPSKKTSCVLAAIVFVLFAMALVYDYIHIRKWFRERAIEDSFVAAFPTTKFYRDYVLRVLEYQPDARTQHFYYLQERDADERIVSVNSMAWIDLRQGPVTVQFPDLPSLRRAAVTFVDWDGIAIGGESAYAKNYTLLPPGSTQPDTPGTLVAQGDTILAFLRIPTADSPDPKQLRRTLENIHFTDLQQKPLKSQAMVAESACTGMDLARIFVACMEALIPVTGLPTEQTDAYQAARKKLGNIERINAADWVKSVDDARQMIDQTVTNGITLVTNHMWIAYQHMFTLSPDMIQLRLNRAAYARADFVAVPSNKMKYAIKRYNARGEAVNGIDHDYILHFDPSLLPPDITEWHFIVRDHRKRLHKYNTKHYVVSYNHALQKETDGTIKIYFSSAKPAGVKTENWLHIPEGFFEIIFMGRGIKASSGFDYFNYLPELQTIR